MAPCWYKLEDACPGQQRMSVKTFKYNPEMKKKGYGKLKMFPQLPTMVAPNRDTNSIKLLAVINQTVERYLLKTKIIKKSYTKILNLILII